MEEETKENDANMESTEEDTAQTIKEDTVEKEVDETEAEKDKSDQLKDETPSDTNDADIMPPPKPQEPSVEPKEPVETDEEMKESSESTAMEEKEEGAAEKSTETTDSGGADVKLPPRPIKKARTAYFIFADEKRAEIAARVSTFFDVVCAFELFNAWKTSRHSLFHFAICAPCIVVYSTQVKESVPSQKKLVSCGLP